MKETLAKLFVLRIPLSGIGLRPARSVCDTVAAGGLGKD